MYDIEFKIRASNEYVDSIDWYKQRSINAARNFVSNIEETLAKLKNNPTQYRRTYKNFHEVSTQKFPFSVIYFIDEEKKKIVIVSIFHHKRSPRKKFKL